MSEIITADYRSVQIITAEIVGIASQTAQLLFISACEMGKRMLEAKELTGRGEWGAYLEDLCKQLGVSKSTAHNWMRLYREYGDSPNFQALGNITYTKAVQLLALPEETREEIIQEQNVEDMSSRELAQVIKDKQAAQEMLAIAQENEADLKRRLEAQSKETSRLQAALDKASAAETDAKSELQKLRDHPEIPPSLIAKTVEDAKAQARSELDAEIKAAREEAAEKEDARANMESALVEAQRQIEKLKQAPDTLVQTLGDPDGAAFEVYLKELGETVNKMHGHYMKAKNRNPSLAAKMVQAFRGITGKLDELTKKMEE